MNMQSLTIYGRAADTLKTQPWRIALLNKGAIVPRQKLVSAEGERGWSWIAATLPLTTSPKDYVLRIKGQVQLDSVEEICQCCKGGQPDPEDGLADIFIQDELRGLLGSEAEEHKAVTENDYSVVTICIREGTKMRSIQCRKRMTAEFLDTYARNKRIKREPVRLLAVQMRDHVLTEQDTYVVHRTMARGV